MAIEKEERETGETFCAHGGAQRASGWTCSVVNLSRHASACLDWLASLPIASAIGLKAQAE